MRNLQIAVLGPFQVQLGEQVVRFTAHKEEALLAYLAVEGGSIPRAQLARLLWPESEARQASSSLRTTLYRLRDALRRPSSRSADEAAYLSVDNEMLGLNGAASFTLDVDDVRRAYEVMRQSLSAAPNPDQQAQLMMQLEQATRLVRGPFLQDLFVQDAAPFEAWVRTQREYWHLRTMEHFEQLARLQEHAGDLAAAVATAQRWHQFDPLNEQAARRLMRLYDAQGNRHLALRCYEELEQRLRSELYAHPAPETLALAQRLRSGAVPQLLSSPHGAERRLTFALQPPPLVGREREMERLIACYERARTGQVQVVLLEGEVGIGKTRLGRDFANWVLAQGGQELHGRAYEVGGRVPYQPIINAIRPRLDEENAPEDLLPDIWLAELSRILPELRERYPDLPPPTQDEALARPQLFEAVVRLLSAWARRRPLLVWVDDVQWADTASLDLLLFLLEQCSQRSVAIMYILSLRGEEIVPATALATWSQALTRMGEVHHLGLAPLSQRETSTLLAQMQDSKPGKRSAEGEAAAHWFYRQTRGVPFYLLEMVRGLLDQRVVRAEQEPEGTWRLDFRGLLARVERGQVVVPETVRDVIRARFTRFAPATRSLLTAASVLDQYSRFAALLSVAQISENEALVALDEVMQSRVLVESHRESREESRYVFAHDLLREVVYQEAGQARQRVLHRRAYETLQMAGPPAAELARHARGAGLVQDAFAWSMRAGDEALDVFAVADAIVFYEQAEELLARPVGGLPLQVTQALPELEHLFLYLGRAYELHSRWEQARAAYQKLRQFARQRQVLLTEVTALNRLAILEGLQASDFTTARDHLHEALALARATGDQQALAETNWNLAQMAMMAWDTAEALSQGERALALARAEGWSELEGRCLYILAQTQALDGQWERVLPLAQEGVRLYRILDGDGKNAQQLSSQVLFVGAAPTQQLTNRAMQVVLLCLLAITEICLGRPREGARVAREAIAISRESGNRWAEVFSILQLNHALMELGAYEESHQLSQDALAQARLLQQPMLIFYMLTVEGMTCTLLGQLEQGYALLREAHALIQNINASSWCVLTLPRLCINRLFAGDQQAAAEYARQASLMRASSGSALIFIDFYRHYEIEALLHAGERAMAVRDIARLAELVGDNRRYRLTLLRSQAAVAHADGNVDEARTLLEEAMRLAAILGLPAEHAQIQAKLSRWRQVGE